MYVIADFGSMFTIEDYKKKIADKVAHLDIGVLALNAGYADMGPFHVNDAVEIEKQCQVNAVHTLYTTKVLIKQLVDRYEMRKLKSGVLFTSSIAHAIPMPGLSTYSTVKRFITHLAQCLNFEFKGKVDVTAYNPGVVTTKMSHAKAESFKIITETRAADVAFKDLGCEISTSGSFRHEFREWQMLHYPLAWQQQSIMATSWIVYERIQKRKAEEAKKT